MGPEWRALGWFGLGLLLVGLVDVALVWYPVRSGNPAWEFGAVDGSLSTAPVLLVGLMAAVVAVLAGAGRWLSAITGGLAVLMTLLCAVGLFLYWTDVPLALSGVPEGAVVGIKKSMVRTTTFGLVLLGASAASAVVLVRTLARGR